MRVKQNRCGKVVAILLALTVNLLVASHNSLPAIEKDESAPITAEARSNFRPAYAVSPIVQKFEARRGQRLGFQFQVTALETDVVVEVMPVALKQDINGAILPDLDSRAPGSLQLLGGAERPILKGQSVSIEGTINVPSQPSTFHTFGVLIRDRPKPGLGARQGQSTFGVKFVTQYILRCDITVTNGRNVGVRELKLEQADIVEYDGLPWAEVLVSNPTQTTVEFELDCRIDNTSAGKSRRFVSLGTAIRSKLPEPERWTTRILPGSQIAMRSPWPSALFAGEYQLQTRLMSGRRVYQQESFPLNIEQDQFRGQASHVALISPSVSVNPSQIALGHEKPLSRFQKLTFRNDSDEAVLVDLTFNSDEVDPTATPWATVRPSQLEIQPGGKRYVVVGLGKISDRTMHKIAMLSITARNAEGTLLGEREVPLAFLSATEQEINLGLGQATLVRDGDIMFTLPVKNESSVPLPLSVTINTRDATGNLVQLRAGFGKWLLPGAVCELEFPLDQVELPVGDIDVTVEFLDSREQSIMRKDLRIP